MDLFEAVRNRRSIRVFRPGPVDEGEVRTLLECSNLAPSAGGLQAYEVVVVRNDDIKRRLARAALDQEFIADAPVVFVFFASPRRSAAKYGKRGERLYCIQDATIAAAYLQLACIPLGLGSVWVGAFDEVAVRRTLRAEGDLIPVAIIPVGRPGESPRPTPRRGVRDIAHRERF